MAMTRIVCSKPLKSKVDQAAPAAKQTAATGSPHFAQANVAATVGVGGGVAPASAAAAAQAGSMQFAETVPIPPDSPLARIDEKRIQKLREEYLEAIEYPGSGETVSSPFTAYGTFDAGSTEADVYLRQKIGPVLGPRIEGVEVPAPPGNDWAEEFTVSSGTYVLFDDQNGESNQSDPIHVT